MVERCLSDLFHQTPSWSLTLLRYQPSRCSSIGFDGEDPQGIPNNLTPYITQSCSREKRKIGDLWKSITLRWMGRGSGLYSCRI